MKKILAIVLTLALIASMSMLSFAELQENVNGNYNPETTNSAYQMYPQGPTEALGSLISTVADAKTICFICPSWSDDIGCLTVTLYKWDTDYETTVKGTPVAGPAVFEDYEDNSPVGFIDVDTPFPAGLYYLEMTEPDDESGSGVGVWSAQKDYPGQRVFVEGVYTPKLSLRMEVDYTTEIEGDPYGEMPEIKAPKTGLGGEGTLPCVYYFNMPDEDLSAFDEYNGVSFEENEDGTLHVFVADATSDSQYSIMFSNLFDFDPTDDVISCQDYPYLAIRLKLNDISYNAGEGEAFFYTTTKAGATPGYSAAITYDWSTDDWQTVVVDPTSNRMFQTYAVEDGDSWLGFRFDPLNSNPTQDVEFDIAWIAFFENEAAALAFDGDFSKVEKPTAAPTPEPTDTPEPTEAPTEAPVEPTDEPAQPTEKAEEKPTEEPTGDVEKDKGCGKFIGSAVGVFLAAGVAVIALKRKER